jgi:hypothetical protein
LTGSIAAAAESRVAPGDGVGALAITGNLTVSDEAILDYELGTLAGSDLISDRRGNNFRQLGVQSDEVQ